MLYDALGCAIETLEVFDGQASFFGPLQFNNLTGNNSDHIDEQNRFEVAKDGIAFGSLIQITVTVLGQAAPPAPCQIRFAAAGADFEHSGL